MNSRVLKILAITLMVIDHAAAVFDFYPSSVWRGIGRLAFPLFTFMIAFGCTKTRSIRKYLMRLVIFAVPVQLLLWLIDGWYSQHFSAELNIFVTFSFSVLTIWMIESVYNKMIVPQKGVFPKVLLFAILVLGTVLIALTGQIANVMYGAAGVMLPVLFWVGLKTTKGMKWRWGLILTVVIAPAIFNVIYMLIYDYYFQWWSMLGTVILWFFSPQKVRASVFEKYFFYAFYPLHFLILYLISMII